MTMLLGCDRHDYTTWSCASASGERFSMVLNKARMQLPDRQLNYCGSLGPNSYFDAKCPTQTTDSSNAFTLGTGKLLHDGKVFDCHAL